MNARLKLHSQVQSTNSLPLIIVLSSVSRAFLRFICRGLRGIYAGYATIQIPSGDARMFYTDICHTLETSPSRADVYERFLAGVDSSIRQAYRAASYGEAERPGPEKDLLVQGRIAGVLMPAISTILRQTVPSVQPEVDRVALYIGDYSWLGFGGDPRSELYRRTHDVDVLKKTQLPNSSDANNNNIENKIRRCRRCVRCCEVTGDTSFPRSVVAVRMFVKLGLLRSCPCGGAFAVEPISLSNGKTKPQGDASSNNHAESR